MSADPISCSWKPLKLNTANCAQGRGKMQVSFSHVGTGGARKTPPLSLGTWPTEGEGYEEALSWYDKVQRIVATCAFGLGINKRGIRQVIHVGPPHNFLDGYVQEIGRGGRGGVPARSGIRISFTPSITAR